MIITHVDEVRDEPCIYRYGEHDEPSFVTQDEGQGSKKHRGRQFAEQHGEAVERRRLQRQFMESKMIE